MLRLKVEKFMSQKRKIEREQQFYITRQLYIKKMVNHDYFLFLEDFDQVNLEQVELFYQKLSENSAQILKQGYISKLSCLFTSNPSIIIKHFNILIPALELLCTESNDNILIYEQLQAFPFFLEVLKLQDIELIDLALNGLIKLSKNKLANFYSEELILYLIDLINLQDTYINIAQICSLILNYQEIQLSNKVIDQLLTSRFRASIIYYLNIDCCNILNFLLKLLDKHIDLFFIVDNVLQKWPVFFFNFKLKTVCLQQIVNSFNYALGKVKICFCQFQFFYQKLAHQLSVRESLFKRIYPKTLKISKNFFHYLSKKKSDIHQQNHIFSSDLQVRIK